MNENVVIYEDGKKKGKVLLFVTIAYFAFSIIYPLLFYFDMDDYNLVLGDIVSLFFFCLVLAFFMLFLCLIAYKHKLIVTEKTIVVNALFGRLSIDFDDIINYTYKKAFSKNEYSFCFVSKNNKKIITGLTHTEEMLNLLEQKGIPLANSK